MKKTNRLTQAQFFQLCQWLANNQERLVLNAPSLSVLAKEAGDKLGTGVESNTVKRAIEASGVKYSPARLMGSQNHAVVIKELMDRVDSLEKLVYGMAKELGYKEPFRVVVKDPMVNGKPHN